MAYLTMEVSSGSFMLEVEGDFDRSWGIEISHFNGAMRLADSGIRLIDAGNGKSNFKYKSMLNNNGITFQLHFDGASTNYTVLSGGPQVTFRVVQGD